MDIEGAEDKFQELKEQLSSEERYESGLGGLEEEMRPRRRIHFDEVIPMSAKFSASSVRNVKDRVRQWLDSYADDGLRTRTDETGLSVQDSAIDRARSELDRLHKDHGPNLV